MIKAMSKDYRALLIGFFLLGMLVLHMMLTSCSSKDEQKKLPQDITPQTEETAGEGLTLMPGESFTIMIGDIEDSSGITLVRENHYFLYQPKDDITPHEIALLLPLFTGVYYGMGEYSAGGAIVPIKDRMRGGWPADMSIPIFKLDSYELSRLGSAKRHLVELSQ